MKRIFLSLGAVLVLGLALWMNFAGSEDQDARAALFDFFNLINEKRYSEAIPLYGGDFSVLQRWNPEIDPQDYFQLFSTGCERNGWHCELRIKEIAAEQKISPSEYQFTVRFSKQDGSLFVLGPCCGETEGPTQTDFLYLVSAQDGKFKVITDPIYTP